MRRHVYDDYRVSNLYLELVFFRRGLPPDPVHNMRPKSTPDKSL